MKSKHWSILLLIFALAALIFLGSITAIIDPFFHYHAPLSFLQYPLDADNERYLNDGIVRHFEYDAIITGTSMTQNFLSSECDALFNVNSIKVPFSGASLAEINTLLRRAFQANPNIKLVICSLDSYQFSQDKNYSKGSSLSYMYDNNIFNDVKYLLNKDILYDHSLKVLDYTSQGELTTSFDTYSMWGSSRTFGQEKVLSRYDRPKAPEALDAPQMAQLPDVTVALSDEYRQNLTENIQQNVIQLAKEHPDTQFLFFFPPYSVLSRDTGNHKGSQSPVPTNYMLLSQLLIEVENIQVFSFISDFDTVTNLDNYKDPYHYSPEVNSRILKCMHNGDFRLTKDNLDSYWQEVMDFYSTFDYDSLFSEVNTNEE